MIVDGVQVCDDPMQAFTMAALLVATWLAQLHHDAGEAHITTSAPPFAVAALSYTLPSLLTHPQWRLAADAVAERLAAVAEHPLGSVGVHGDILVSFCKLLDDKSHIFMSICMHVYVRKDLASFQKIRSHSCPHLTISTSLRLHACTYNLKAKGVLNLFCGTLCLICRLLLCRGKERL